MWKRMIGLALTVVCALGTLGCSEDTAGGPSGSVDIGLEIGGSAQVDEVVYTIFGNNMTMSGIIDTSAPGATASVEVFGIPEGSGYRVELVAIIGDAEPCRGSAPFSILAGQVTPVMVMLNCKPEERFGSVRVNGKLNICAHLEKAVVSPLQTSVGSRIDLFAQGADAESDFIEYGWFAANGQIANPTLPFTSYVCTSEGTDFIDIFLSDDSFQDCIDSWRVEVRCVGSDGGTGGAGGAGGTGGTGGTSGTGGTGGTGGVPACVPSSDQCQNGDIGSIQEDPLCMLDEPPVLEDACQGTESLENATSCTPTGNTSLHQIQLLQVARDCNAGYDLDQCDGESCNIGSLAPGEGLDGVDSALTGLAPVLTGVGGDLVGVDQAFYDGLCSGDIDIALEVDPNLGEGCVTVTPVLGGIPADPIFMNLSPTGCISGELGTIPVTVGGVPGQIDNALIRGTADVARGFNMLLGGTVDEATAGAIADALIDGGSAVVRQVLDISEDLTGDVSTSCNALSLSLDVGGTLVGSGAGACTDGANAAVYANLTYTDDRGIQWAGTDAADAISRDCLRGSTTSLPPVAGCGSETIGVVACFPNCPPEPIAELGNCIADCTQGVTAEVASPGLSDMCASCYGAAGTCLAAQCVDRCAVDSTAPLCLQCQCDAGCIPDEVQCSGIPTDACDI